MGLWALLACLLAVQSCSVSVSVRRASGPLLAHSLQHTTVKLTDRTKPLCSDYIIWQLLSTWLSTRPCWPTVPPPILGKRSVMSLFILCRKTLKMKRRISFSKQFLSSSIFALLLFSLGLGGLCGGECGVEAEFAFGGRFLPEGSIGEETDIKIQKLIYFVRSGPKQS